MVYIGGTCNVNLGDNAQRMLIAKWCKENFNGHVYIEIPIDKTACQVAGVRSYGVLAVLSATLFKILKIMQHSGDIFVTGSGYGLIDHASTWLAYARLAVACRNTPILMMPQTINFMNPWMAIYAARAFNQHGRMLMLCRDLISLEKAKESFSTCHPVAYPDIVTSLIGTRNFSGKRDGILFCVRDDGEAYYDKGAIQSLKSRFSCRVAERDTNLSGGDVRMDEKREAYIEEFLAYMSGFKAVITDRYHGTIFSLVTNTPVVVLASNDHKLSSGVKWFPPEIFTSIKYAKNIDDAYAIASEFIASPVAETHLPPYFKERYWDLLIKKLEVVGVSST